MPKVRDRKGTPKNLCNKDFAELSGELSGATCLKALVLLGIALELFRELFGAICAILWLWVLVWLLIRGCTTTHASTKGFEKGALIF